MNSVKKVVKSTLTLVGAGVVLGVVAFKVIEKIEG